MKKLIVDCDPGQDDAIALLLALSSPEVDLLAITTVAGNVSELAANANARQLLEAADRRDVPLYHGCVRPLLRPSEHYFEDDADGLRGVTLPEPLLDATPGHAVDAIIDVVRSHKPQTITLCALGPLTNVAVALAKDPELADLLGGIALMGGASGLGNITPAAEFNVLTDPHAAAVVFASGANITMFGLEVCHRAVVHADWVAQLADFGTPAAKITAGLLESYGSKADAHRYRVLGLPLYDPCVIAWILAPELFTGSRHRVDIELEGRFCQGRTVVDVQGLTGKPPNATLMTDLDLGAFRELLLDGLGRLRSLRADRTQR